MVRRSTKLRGKSVKVKRHYRRRRKAPVEEEATPDLSHELHVAMRKIAHLEARLADIPQQPTRRPITVERELARKVDAILQSRGSSAEAFVELMFKGFLNSKCELGLSDTLNFGKYMGENVQHVCNTDLAYMYWLAVEQRSRKFKEEVRVYVQNLAADEVDYLDDF